MMKSLPQLTHKRTDHSLQLSGDLVVETAGRAYDCVDDWLGDDVQIVDLGGVGRSDSAALALMVVWKRERPALQFSNVPRQLQALARLSDLTSLLDI